MSELNIEYLQLVTRHQAAICGYIRSITLGQVLELSRLSPNHHLQPFSALVDSPCYCAVDRYEF